MSDNKKDPVGLYCSADLQGQFLRWDIIRLVGKFASFEDILICPTTKTFMGQTSLSSQGDKSHSIKVMPYIYFTSLKCVFKKVNKIVILFS